MRFSEPGMLVIGLLSRVTLLTREGVPPIAEGRGERGDPGFPVWQAWLDQLPRGFEGRIRHGVRIDPRTLRGEAGIVHLTVRGDSLVLLRHAVRPAPSQ